MTRPNMTAICAWCSLTFGAHNGTDNRCPGHEGRMDWDAGPGTVFIDSGWIGIRPYGAPARKGGWTPEEIGIPS